MNIYHDNKYTKWYYNIINAAKTQNREKGNGVYYEKHHILPKCLCPELADLSENPSNGVLLTAREHYICHWLLTKMVSGFDKSKMYLSFVRTCHNGKVTARQFEKAKTIRNNHIKGKNHPCYGKPSKYKGIKRPVETIEKMKKSLTGRTLSNEHRKNISLGNIGKTHTEKTKQQISQSKKGILFSENHKKSLSLAWHSENRINSMKNRKPRKTTPYTFNNITYNSKKEAYEMLSKEWGCGIKAVIYRIKHNTWATFLS